MTAQFRQRRIRFGFSLVELLVVILIVSILAAFLLPTMEQAVLQARLTVCMGNQRQIYLGYNFYSNDFRDRMPNPVDGHYNNRLVSLEPGSPYPALNLGVFYKLQYMVESAIVFCPDHSYSTASAIATGATCAQNLRIAGSSVLYASSTYVVRGPYGLSTEWDNSVDYYYIYSSGTASKLSGNLPGGRFVRGPGATLRSPRAIVMCGVPVQYWGYNPEVHRREALTALYADGVAASIRVRPGMLWMEPTGIWLNKFVGADGYYPSYVPPVTGTGASWINYANAYGYYWES